jgi:hypothetical protein
MPIVLCLDGPMPKDHTAAAFFAHFLAKVNAPVGADETASRYEEPTKGNEYGLTVREHVFPRKSIARFSNKEHNNFVNVALKSQTETRWNSPNNKLFCAMRAWSEREEKGFMDKIEVRFQCIAEAVIDASARDVALHLDDNENYAITSFFALWYMRARYRNIPTQKLHLHGVAGHDFTEVQKEFQESNKLIVADKDGGVPYRQLNGLVVEAKAKEYANQLRDIRWGIIASQEGDFLVQDVPTHTIIPVCPKICLIGALWNFEWVM